MEDTVLPQGSMLQFTQVDHCKEKAAATGEAEKEQQQEAVPKKEDIVVDEGKQEEEASKKEAERIKLGEVQGDAPDIPARSAGGA